MSTTTIRLPEELKARVAAAADNVGVSSHSFILQAITEKLSGKSYVAMSRNRRNSVMPTLSPRVRPFPGTICVVIWKAMSPEIARPPSL